MKRAVIFGASGFVGSYVLRDLLNSPDYEQVTAVVRKPLEISHPKLKLLIGDIDSLPSLAPQISADEAFLTLGTTRKNTPDQAEYYRIDHDYPVAAARIAKERGAQSVFLLTAVGAKPKSNFFYARAKGETERDVIALGFQHTHIFRPSMILGTRQQQRAFWESALMKTWPALHPLLWWNDGQYKGMTGEDIGKAMVRSAKDQADNVKIYHWKEMHELLQS